MKTTSGLEVGDAFKGKKRSGNVQFIVPVGSAERTGAKTSVVLSDRASRNDACQILLIRLNPGEGWPTAGAVRDDRLVFVCSGSLSVRREPDTAVVDAQSLIRLPSMIDIELRNAGAVELVCLEIAATGTSSAAPWPSLSHLISRFDGHGPIEKSSGFDYHFLANRKSGSLNVALNIARVLPGQRGPDFHIHKFDQFYFVLAGELTVEIGFHKHVVGPYTLVKLPSGIVHRQGNAGVIPEEHVAIICPAPQEGEPLDYQILMPTV